MDLSFPLSFSNEGRTASVDSARHIKDMIEQVLFTAPGERVNRPEFGSGLFQLAFSPNGPELAAAVQAMVQGALHRWLGDTIAVHGLEVTAQDATLLVEVRYVVNRTAEERVDRFERRYTS